MKKFLVLAFFMASSFVYANYDDALVLFQKKQYKKSLSNIAQELVVAKDLEKGSPNYKLRFLAAHNHWKLGNLKSAIIHFKRCMDIDGAAVAPYVDLALLLIDYNRFADAESVAIRGLKVKKSPDLYWVLGRIKIKEGKFQAAKEFFSKSVAADPEVFIYNFDLGVSLLKLKKYGEANTAFSAATILNTQSAQAYNNLAYSFYMMYKGKKSKPAEYIKSAKENIEKAVDLDPKNKRIEKTRSMINSVD